MNALSKSMLLLQRKSHKLLSCTQRLRVTTSRSSLHYSIWCSKISFLDHPLRIQISIFLPSLDSVTRSRGSTKKMGSLSMMRGSVSRKCLDFVPTMVWKSGS
ncbi:hypothetical protein MTR_0381s0030 [Medicago truncatula]|uniref:Uncharacterized protein n=1 Tax=Medicago truncatula TaxID=3880 RepID=A0A072TF62_MEDTR|nr:hypothetical protein MTR_0381s0030 [Medicago truncatula]